MLREIVLPTKWEETQKTSFSRLLGYMFPLRAEVPRKNVQLNENKIRFLWYDKEVLQLEPPHTAIWWGFFGMTNKYCSWNLRTRPSAGFSLVWQRRLTYTRGHKQQQYSLITKLHMKLPSKKRYGRLVLIFSCIFTIGLQVEAWVCLTEQ